MRDPTRQAERLMAIRLRYTINTHLEDQGITTPAAIGAAAGLPAAEAVGLLTRRQWRAGDVAALQAVAERLGLQVVPPDTSLLRGKSGPGEGPAAPRQPSGRCEGLPWPALPAAPARRALPLRLTLQKDRYEAFADAAPIAASPWNCRMSDRGPPARFSQKRGRLRTQA